MQCYAGYIIEGLYELIKKSYPELQIDSLYKSLCSFELEFNEDKQTGTPSPELSVMHNLVSRGLPTLISYDLESIFIDTFSFLERIESETGELKVQYDLTKEQLEITKRSLFIIDPRMSGDKIYRKNIHTWEKLDSNYEERFLYDIVPNLEDFDSPEILFQLMAIQRPINSIANIQSYNEFYKQKFKEQKIDFSLEIPFTYDTEGKKAVIIEVDGKQHDEEEQKQLDDQRDRLALGANCFPTIRLRTREWSNFEDKLENLRELCKSNYIKEIIKNYKNQIYQDEIGLDLLCITLSPILIARIQKSLIEFLIRNEKILKKDKVKVVVIERDLPGSHLAIYYFLYTLTKIYGLEDRDPKLPIFDITTYSTENFINSKLNQNIKQVYPFNDIKKDTNKYDLLIDASVLIRADVSGKDENFMEDVDENFIHLRNHSKNSIRIRSSKYYRPEWTRKFLSNSLIKYSPIVQRKDNDQFEEFPTQKKILEYFIRTIFRKKKFRVGQLPIIDRALQLKSVIGLLPTGGGKSLAYQLCALLQPGHIIIVDPIKSLMQDQVNNLFELKIDACSFINSSQSDKEKREVMNHFAEGKSIFLFISPERIQIKDFRKILEEFQSFFSYAVIDEAHCVSEWGHDFRPSYLSLGKNLMKFCKTKNLDNLPLIGLTATASYDVLSDILRELSTGGNNSPLEEESIIKFESTNRPEIFYDVVKIELGDEKENRINQESTTDDMRFREEIGKLKQEKLRKYLSDLPSKIQKLNKESESLLSEQYKEIPNSLKRDSIKLNNIEFENFYQNLENAGVIFTPHRSWYFGVTDTYKNGKKKFSGVYDILQIEGVKKGTFLGSNSDDEIEKDNEKNQFNFVNNQMNLMVCTKAFGMGIDKSNIRYSVHFNYPSSIESFVQESGRIGRDGKLSVAAIVYNDDKFLKNDNEENISIDQKLLLDFHNTSFKGAEKELAILDELLFRISFPSVNHISNLNKKLEDNKINGFSFGISPNRAFVDHERIYINNTDNTDTNQSMFLDLNTSGFRNEAESFKKPKQILIDYIQKNKPENIDLYTWMNQGMLSEGILPKLTKINLGDKMEIVVGFENDTSDIIEKLSSEIRKVSNRFTIDWLKDKNKISMKGDIFINKVEEFLRSRTNNNAFKIKSSNIRPIKELYSKIRIKTDTEKAIYRLMLIGVVDDYTVDFNANNFTLHIKKKTEKEYIEYLSNYLRLFFTVKKTDEELQKIKGKNIEDLIKRILDYIVKFAYNEIANKRLASINAMEEACIIGSQENIDQEERNIELKKHIDLYFNSKYARKNYAINGENFSLTDRTDNGKIDDLVILWDFIRAASELDHTNTQKDNFKHLRGACTRLLIVERNNLTLLLLKSFATFIVEEERLSNSRLVDEAKEQFTNAISELSTKDDYQYKIEEIFDKYWQLLIQNIDESKVDFIKEIMEESKLILNLKSNRIWLENFNNKFLVNYERTNS